MEKGWNRRDGNVDKANRRLQKEAWGRGWKERMGGERTLHRKRRNNRGGSSHLRSRELGPGERYSPTGFLEQKSVDPAEAGPDRPIPVSSSRT